MATVPQTLAGKIEFFEQHLPVWAATPTAIGLTAVQIASLNTLVTQARADYQAALTARNAAKAKTEIQRLSIDAMFEVGSDYIKTIRAFADLTNNPNVYAIAQIPAPQPPQPAGPPEQPTDIAAQLLPSGGLRLTWKGTLSQKAFFSVYRRTEGQTNFVLLDSPTERRYDDLNIPTGANSLTYYIQARRDDFRIDSGYFQVNFGTGAGTTVTTLSLAA